MKFKCHANNHAMIAIQTISSLIQQIIEKFDTHSCEMTCFNESINTIVNEKRTNIDSLSKRFEVHEVKITILEVSFVFHFAQMNSILNDIRVVSRQINYCEFAMSIASTLLDFVVRTQNVSLRSII